MLGPCVGAGAYNADELVMSHSSVNFDRTGFQQDINIVFPVDRLRDLEAEMTPSELDAARTWHDPNVNKGYQRPLSSIVGAVANQEGRYELAARCFQTTMNSVPLLSEQSVRFAYLYCRALQRASGGSLPEEANHVAQDALERALMMIQLSSEPEPARTLAAVKARTSRP